MGTQLPLPLPKGGAIFGPYLLQPNGWMDQDATWYGGRPQPRRLCVRWGPRSTLLGLSPGDCVLAPPKFLAHVYYSYCDFVRTLHNAQSLLVFTRCWPVTGHRRGAFSTLLRRPGLRASTDGVLATTRRQNVSEYMLVLALCLVDVSGNKKASIR